jgi:hypothetical protein
MNNSLASLTIPQLKRALALKERISRLNKQLDAILGASAGAEGKPAKKRTMSAAGRAAISRAAKARWAKLRAAK